MPRVVRAPAGEEGNRAGGEGEGSWLGMPKPRRVGTLGRGLRGMERQPPGEVGDLTAVGLRAHRALIK